MLYLRIRYKPAMEAYLTSPFEKNGNIFRQNMLGKKRF